MATPATTSPTRKPTTLKQDSAMIYDVASPQFQQFLRAARRREDYAQAKSQGAKKSLIAKPGGASSTGL